MLTTAFSTLILDILNYKAAKVKVNTSIGTIVSEAESKKREKIPKRATLINTCLFLPLLAYTGVIGNSSDMSLETRSLLVTIPNAVVNALRLPIVASWAFQANRQIGQETVNDRRNQEIKEALRKKAKRNSLQEILDVMDVMDELTNRPYEMAEYHGPPKPAKSWVKPVEPFAKVEV